MNDLTRIEDRVSNVTCQQADHKVLLVKIYGFAYNMSIMIPFISIPAKIIKLLEANVSPKEVAAGVCLGMFMGFIPLNGWMTLVLILFFLFFKLNRISTLLTLPIFKLFYFLGAYKIADFFGGIVLIKASFLEGFLRYITNFPLLTFLDLNNTLVIGGIILSCILIVPVFYGATIFARKMQTVYGENFKEIKFIKWIKNFPIVSKAGSFISKLRGSE